MSEEFLLSVDTDSACGSATVWRAVSGSRVAVTRGPAIDRGDVALLANSTLLAGEIGRFALGAWPLSPTDQSQRRHALTGRVTAVATDPAGVWCAVALSDRLAIHHCSSGRQVALLSRHFQPITCVCFSDDGAALVTAGRDALTIAWLLAACVDTEAGGQGGGEPLHVWCDHALPVTGLRVSGGGAARARVFTVSADATCRVYRLSSGQQLLVIPAASIEGATGCSFTALCVAADEQWLYLGTNTGSIHTVSLREPPRSLTATSAGGGANCPQFVGHTAAVLSLSLAARASLMASASEDGSVRVWRLDNGQCCHSLPTSGSPLAVLFFTAPSTLLAPGGVAPRIRLAPLQRQPPVSGAAVDLDVRLVDQSDSEDEDGSETDRYLYDKLAHSQRINASLYNFMLEKISNGVFSTGDADPISSPPV